MQLPTVITSKNLFFFFCFLFLLINSIKSNENPSSAIISRFQQYLQINTAHPNPNYYEATDFIISQAKSLSLESNSIEFVKSKPLILLKWSGKNPNLSSILLNSHMDVVPVESHKWVHHPFDAQVDSDGNIHARGTQDMKSVGMQYLEAIRKLKDSGFEPSRTIYLSFVPDEEIGGLDGAAKLAQSDVFEKMNVAFVLDEGMPSPNEKYRAYYAERSPMWLVIKATGAPGHGAKLYDNTAMENLMKSIESIRSFRASQLDMLKTGLKGEGEVVSVNMVYLKAGTETPKGFVMNLQPSEAEAGIDIRVPPTLDHKSLEKRIAEEWAPTSRNMTFEFKLKVPLVDKFGKPTLTATDNSNPWWVLLEKAVHDAGGELEKPEINIGTTDARYFRQQGLPAIGFSPIANTPLLLHDHNEKRQKRELPKMSYKKRWLKISSGSSCSIQPCMAVPYLLSNKHLFLFCFLSFFFITNKSTAHSPSSSSSSSIIFRFQEYLRINTAYPNPNYYEAVDFILSQAKSLSLESQTIEFVENKPLILLKWPGKNPKLQSILLNSHTDVVPAEPNKWEHHPFSAHIDSHGNIFARAIRKLKASGFEPTRTIYISFVPDEENGGLDGAEKLAESDLFEKMNVAFVLDEGMPSPNEKYQVFYAERSLMWLVIKAIGAPGHGAKLCDNTAMENLMKSIESIRSFRASQFDMVKAGLKTEGDVVSVNMVFLKAGTQTPTGFVMNLQPSEAEAGFDLRVPPTADLKSLEKRISEEWAPASRNMTFEFVQKDPLLDKFGKPILTVADNSNPWWFLFEEAVQNAGGKLEIPEILLGSTDASFFRQRGLPAIGFSAIANTPDRVHDHNEFLNQEEYLKGVDMYASIIKAYASYAVHTEAEASTYEL
ncbi:Aminoacylase-1 [Bienertia sinuspersici]